MRLLSAWILALGIAASGLVSVSAWAEVYYYKDEQGRTFFSNIPNNPKYRSFRYFGRGGAPPDDVMIAQCAARYGLDPALIKAMIRAESNFKEDAVSRAGAKGLMQLMPETAQDMQVADPFNAQANLEGGSRYFRMLMDRFQDKRLALAAYNAGPSRVEQYNGVPPFRETRTYIDRVLKYYEEYKKTKDFQASPRH